MKARFHSAISCLAIILLIVTAATSAIAQAAPPTVVFMTDFGVVDDSVAICKGVMYGVAPNLRIVDISHQVTPFSIFDGARFLFGVTPYFPAGTVFVVVVDPGVGSTRKAVVVKTKRGQYFVLPDNGLMTLVEKRDGILGLREITNPDWMVGAKISSTFHGRDIFSPVGAHLARGEDWTKVGPEIKALVLLDLAPAQLDERGLHGKVIATDGPFGNLVTNIDGEQLLQLGYQRGQEIPVKIGEREFKLPFVKTFSDVAIGKPLVYVDSRGRVGLAVNQASFAALYELRPPQPVMIYRKGN